MAPDVVIANVQIIKTKRSKYWEVMEIQWYGEQLCVFQKRYFTK